ncbi:hypothetical protein BgiBS90_010365 [Biomphalaria glabrata]|nr:hypothetical protein BgiBS90_010365 [Biomphalaria glabrata]
MLTNEGTEDEKINDKGVGVAGCSKYMGTYMEHGQELSPSRLLGTQRHISEHRQIVFHGKLLDAINLPSKERSTDTRHVLTSDSNL